MINLIERLLDLFDAMQMALIGAVGALISLRFHPERKQLTTATVFVFSGAAIAYFITGLAADTFKIKSDHAGAIGFLLGAFGGSLFAAIVKGINEADLWEFVKSKFGGTKGGE